MPKVCQKQIDWRRFWTSICYLFYVVSMTHWIIRATQYIFFQIIRTFSNHPIVFRRCSLWLLYGMLIHDKSIIIVNAFGSSLQYFYAFTYYIFSVKKNIIVKQMLLALAFISSMYLYWFVAEDVALVTQRIGFISCAFTILFFASPLTMLVSLNSCFNYFIN